MYEFEDVAQMLDQIADAMPYELYRDFSLGNAIVFYYGSIVRIYGHVGREELYRQLTRILHHEVRHHNEYLAGTDDLGIWDEEQIVDYLKRNGVKPNK